MRYKAPRTAATPRRFHASVFDAGVMTCASVVIVRLKAIRIGDPATNAAFPFGAAFNELASNPFRKKAFLFGDAFVCRALIRNVTVVTRGLWRSAAENSRVCSMARVVCSGSWTPKCGGKLARILL